MEIRWIIAAIVVIVLAGLAFWVWRSQESKRLKQHYGPEYERLARTEGPGGAERTLAERERRVHKLDIRSLAEPERLRFVDRWRRVQARFVDDPRGVIAEADGLIGEVMAARGYPVGDFEQRAADVSVDHPHVVENYRIAHSIGSRVREATTEDLRKAMLHFRRLFDDLLVSGDDRESKRNVQEEEREVREETRR